MADPAADERGRGREATSPRGIPKAGWRDILLRVWDRMGKNHVSLVAAGVGFYGLLAIFPAITAMVSIWGLALDPQTITQQIDQLSGILPEQTRSIVADQAAAIAEGAGAGASLAAIGGIVLALYSSMKGVSSLIEGLNIIYGEEEKRGFVRRNLLALTLTAALILMMIGTLALMVVYPLLVGALGFGGMFQTLVNWLRWPLLALVAVVGMAILYRYGPSRTRPGWAWVGWGAAAGTALWIVASIGFSIYLRYFGAYNETYGTLGAAIALLMWFWVSSFAVLMGAELASEIEHQTARDTTVGPDRPTGQRGAHVADTLGERR